MWWLLLFPPIFPPPILCPPQSPSLARPSHGLKYRAAGGFHDSFPLDMEQILVPPLFAYPHTQSSRTSRLCPSSRGTVLLRQLHLTSSLSHDHSPASDMALFMAPLVGNFFTSAKAGSEQGKGRGGDPIFPRVSCLCIHIIPLHQDSK